MLHDLDSTIEQVLRDVGKIQKPDVQIVFDQPNREWSGKLSTPSINCWCFDVRENKKLRNMDLDYSKSLINESGRPTPAIRRELAPRRFDLYYLITAWAPGNNIRDEHLLMWRALQAFSQVRLLEPENCIGTMQNQPYTIPVFIGSRDDYNPNLTDIWSVIDNDMHLGFTVVFTLALDTQLAIEAPLVMQDGRTLSVGPTSSPGDAKVGIGKTETFKGGRSRQSQEDES